MVGQSEVFGLLELRWACGACIGSERVRSGGCGKGRKFSLATSWSDTEAMMYEDCEIIDDNSNISCWRVETIGTMTVLEGAVIESLLFYWQC